MGNKSSARDTGSEPLLARQRAQRSAEAQARWDAYVAASSTGGHSQARQDDKKRGKPVAADAAEPAAADAGPVAAAKPATADGGPVAAAEPATADAGPVRPARPTAVPLRFERDLRYGDLAYLGCPIGRARITELRLDTAGERDGCARLTVTLRRDVATEPYWYQRNFHQKQPRARPAMIGVDTRGLLGGDCIRVRDRERLTAWMASTVGTYIRYYTASSNGDYHEVRTSEDAASVAYTATSLPCVWLIADSGCDVLDLLCADGIIE